LPLGAETAFGIACTATCFVLAGAPPTNLSGSP